MLESDVTVNYSIINCVKACLVLRFGGVSEFIWTSCDAGVIGDRVVLKCPHLSCNFVLSLANHNACWGLSAQWDSQAVRNFMVYSQLTFRFSVVGRFVYISTSTTQQSPVTRARSHTPYVRCAFIWCRKPRYLGTRKLSVKSHDFDI